MVKKPAFVINTHFGRVTQKSNFYKMLNYSDLVRASRNVNFKAGAGGLPSNLLKISHKVFDKHAGLTQIGLRIGSHLILQGLDNRQNNLHAGNGQIPLVSTSSSSGKSSAKSFKASFYIGYPNKAIGRFLRLPNYKSVTKELFNTETDLMSNNRTHLVTRSGFNQKKFIFLQKAAITPNILNSLYSEAFNILVKEGSEHDQSIQMAAISGAKSDLPELSKAKLFAVLDSSRLTFKISNELHFYNISVRVHLIEIRNPLLSLKKMLNNTFHKTLDLKKAANNIENYSHRIPFSQQLSGIEQNSGTSFQVNTAVGIGLNSSLFFQNNCRIVKSATRTLEPGDCFNVTVKELFKSIDLTSLYSSLKSAFIDKNHPLNYITCIEYVGDSRSKIVGISDPDIIHIGNGLTRNLLQTKFTVKYLASHSILDSEQPLFYRQKSLAISSDPQDITTAFSKSIAQYFCPDRSETMNLDYEDVLLFGMNSRTKTNKKYKYKMSYDSAILDHTTELSEAVEALKENFNSFNEETQNLNPEDINFMDFNLKNTTSDEGDTFLENMKNQAKSSAEEDDEDEEF